MKKKIYLIIIHIFAAIGLFLTLAYIAILLGFTKSKGIVDLNRQFMNGTSTSQTNTPSVSMSWEKTEEYLSFKNSIAKDQKRINDAAGVAHINSRLIVSSLLAEQIRLYTDASRESFKQFFQPLQILGIQSQYSWGVMGLKRETAIQIEDNLKATSSPYYLGPEYEHLLDFNTSDTETERFDRLINKRDQYYSYLYAALYMKQIMKQWSDAGYPIEKKPEIIATLYNIGFTHSQPNPHPQAGGAQINVGGRSYSFGGLAHDFFYSDELTNYFPSK